MDEYGDGRKYRKEAAAISGLYCCQTAAKKGCEPTLRAHFFYNRLIDKTGGGDDNGFIAIGLSSKGCEQ